MKLQRELCIAICSTLFAGTTHAISTSDEASIQHLIEQFQQAIKTKSNADLVGLFVDENSPITASASDKTFAKVGAKKPDAAKILNFTSAKFAADISQNKESTEETFSNVKIDADDAAAAVSFDFTFLRDGKPVNAGKEAWLLVKTEKEWKISSIVFSMNFPEKK